MAKNNKKEVFIFKQFNVKQFIALIFGILFFGTGIALLILYHLEAYAPSRSALKEALSAALTTFNNGTHTNLGFLGWGIIVLLIGAIIIALSLSFASKLQDREKEREARREIRRKALKEATAEDTIDSVIDTINEN